MVEILLIFCRYSGDMTKFFTGPLKPRRRIFFFISTLCRKMAGHFARKAAKYHLLSKIAGLPAADRYPHRNAESGRAQKPVRSYCAAYWSASVMA